jgi:hypothetical protein
MGEFYNEWGFCASARVLGYQGIADLGPAIKKAT